MQKALATPGINDAIKMTFYNTYAPGRVPDGYDCSKTNSTGQGGNITKYCLESRYESCVMDAHCPLSGNCTAAGQLAVSNFLSCGEGIPYTTKHHTAYEDLPPCAIKYGIDDAAIQKCAESADAVTIIEAVDKATHAANPPVKYFPDIRINGKQCQGCQNEADFIKTICAAIVDGPKPAACSKAALQTMQDQRQA